MIVKNLSSFPHSLATALAALSISVLQSHAATFSQSTTPPAVNGTDIGQFGGSQGGTFDVGKWFTGNTHPGQTFTPATNVLFNALTLRTGTGSSDPGFTFRIRVSSISGGNLTVLRSETATWTSGPSSNGSYLTFTLASPLALNAGTTYAVDVEFVSSTTPFDNNLIYLYWSGSNPYSGGSYYTFGPGGTSVGLNTGRDYTFHLDMSHPQAPTPDIGATVPSGNVNLGWVNLPPTTGTDVWVDVWFGTNPNAMTKVVDQGLNITSFTASAPVAGNYYWRLDSYLAGAPTGSPTTGQVFNFIVTDSDNDGLPDAYELLHTNPASNLTLNPGDDLDTDGLTNLQEFQRGTLPLDSDTDNDTLLDGPELTGVGLRAATNPLVADTDNDGLNDGAESNTGTFVSASDTGTNPIIADTDADGLKDGVETNTGTFVSTSNTGTSPFNTNTDGDTAGDWYEVVTIDTNPSLPTQPNFPNNASLKPNIPYPLPDPDNSTGATDKKVKVYIMSGQSNMVGFGEVNGGGAGTLQTITGAEKKFPNLVASGGGWTTRKDVKYQGVITDVAKGDLKADVAGTRYGPELGFGYAMGWYHDEPVLLIKASQGNRGLMWDMLPPGSPRTVFGEVTYSAYGEAPEVWPTASGPSPFVWYAGKQYDDFFLKENDMGALPWAAGLAYPASGQVRRNGAHYVCKAAHTSSAATEPEVGANWTTYWQYYDVFNTADVLDNFATQYPSWAAQGFEIAGYVWWQGYDDTGEPRATRYEPNMVQFIKQIRSYFENRYNTDGSTLTQANPNAPFVLATLATNGGWGNTDPGSAKVAQAQLNVDGTTGLHPEFAGNVKTMEARGYWRDASISPSGQGYHYNWNAETYLLVGDALGRAMIDLQSAPDVANPTLASLAPANLATGIASSSNLAISFNESVARGTGFITLKNITDASQTQINITDVVQVSISGSVLTINPTADLIEGKSYAIQIDPTAIDDLVGNSYDGITDDTTWSFATAAPAPPVLVSLSPADDATTAVATTNLVVTFNENVLIGSGNITIKNLSDATQSTIAITDASQVSVSGAVLTINPTVDLAVGKNYAIQIASTAITDATSGAFPGISDDTTWNFTTVILPPNTAIWVGNSGNWSTAGTWVSGVIGSGVDFNINFTGVDLTADQTITLDSARTVGNITFEDATNPSHNLTISGANVLTLDRTSGVPTIDVTQAGRTLTISSVIAGNDGLQKNGLGSLTLTGNNTYTGTTTVNGGTLRLEGGTGGFFSSTSATRNYVINSGAILNLHAAGVPVGTANLSGAGTLLISGSGLSASNSGRAMNINLTAGSLIDIASGAGWYNGGWQAFTWTNNKATLNVNGGLDMADGKEIIADALTGSGAFSASQSSGGNVNLTLGVNNGSGTFNGTITNTGTRVVSLVKNGSGTQTLVGSSTFRGATTVNAGTLAISGSLSTTGVTVANNATLGGNGNITGNVSIASGARHALAVAATPAAQVTRTITGTLTLTSGNILDLTAAAPPAAGVYVLATATTAITGTPTTINYGGIDGVVTVDTASSPKRLLLTVTAPTSTYASWIAGYPGAAAMPGFTQDADNDGIENGIENFFGTNPTTTSTGLLPGTKTGNTFTFTHPQNASPASNITATYRWSKNLATFHDNGVNDGNGTTVNFTTVTNAGITTVTATVTGTAAEKLFVDVKVLQN